MVIVTPTKVTFWRYNSQKDDEPEKYDKLLAKVN